MIGIKEMSELSGVSKRTLQYYDRVGLLRPAAHTRAGYRLYDAAALERLQQILLYRELEFSLKEIKTILDSTDYDRNRALEQQIELLTLKKQRLESLILFARGLHGVGVKHMDFSAFDTRMIDEYTRRAKETWGQTPEYREYERKHAGRTTEAENALGKELMALLADFGNLRHLQVADAAVQAQVQKLRDFITEHFYTCSVPVLRQLGRMYSGGGSMMENINAAGGEGTAEFAARAIEVYCACGGNKKD